MGSEEGRLEEGRTHRGGEERHVLWREDPMSISAEYKGLNDVGLSSQRSVW